MIVIGFDVHKRSVTAVAVDEAGRSLSETTDPGRKRGATRQENCSEGRAGRLIESSGWTIPGSEYVAQARRAAPSLEIGDTDETVAPCRPGRARDSASRAAPPCAHGAVGCVAPECGRAARRDPVGASTLARPEHGGADRQGPSGQDVDCPLPRTQRDATRRLPRSAAVVGPRRNPLIPLVISPHGRGITPGANARIWASCRHSAVSPSSTPKGRASASSPPRGAIRGRSTI